MSTHRETWQTYMSLWGPLSTAERQAGVQEALHPNCEYRDPRTTTTGIDDLVTYMEHYQQEFPGSTIEMRYFLSHNDRCTVRWEIEDPERNVVMDGTSYGEFDPEGKIVTMCGFYEMPEPAEVG